jgi:hypothetical protein
MRTAIVAPCHIMPSAMWCTNLRMAAHNGNADVIIVDDSNGVVDYPFKNWEGFKIFDYRAQEIALGRELYQQFTQFHKSSSCKNFGLWYAYKHGYESVIVIDSDCIVEPQMVREFNDMLEQKGQGWANPLFDTGFYSRGFPYSKRNIKRWLHMGLWTNELDLYGTDRLHAETEPPKMPSKFYSTYFEETPFFPLSGMNVAFAREAIPYMLFLPNFSYGDEDFSRHDDIWGGYILQKAALANNKALSFGMPYVLHDTIVIPEEDAKEEEAMIEYEDIFYEFVDNAFKLNFFRDHKSMFAQLAFDASVSQEFYELEKAFEYQARAYKDLK